MISRITGGDPMGRHPVQPRPSGGRAGAGGSDARFTDIATKENWKEVVKPSEPARTPARSREDLLRAGQHPFLAVAVALNAAFKQAGVEVPKIGRVRRCGPALEKAGIVRCRPAAAVAAAGRLRRADGCDRRQGELRESLRPERRGSGRRALKSPKSSRLPTMPAACRRGTNVQDWNQATNMVITARAGRQIWDWAQGESSLRVRKPA